MSSDDDGGHTRRGTSSTVGWTPLAGDQLPISAHRIIRRCGVAWPWTASRGCCTLPPLNEPKGELCTLINTSSSSLLFSI